MPIDDFQKIDEEFFNTILEDDFFFEGDIKTQDALMVKGALKGTIESDNLIVVGPMSVINADIKTKVLQCFGKIVGNISASEMVHIHAPASVMGDISAPLLTIEKGCSVNGKISMPITIQKTNDSEVL
ncbi:MAG: polymer-forming cytoskeletal protein [Spirochaetales bacterium]|nr:polymer-forming cytoskeletal protein [Spirochaetales bacterium]MBR2317891.1 polymer-forming cytoskeletal protein [Spirochaetales bacterium]